MVCKLVLVSSNKPHKSSHTGAECFFLSAVISRECYQCLSTHSWRDCDAKRIRVTCLGSTRCVKASAHRRSGYTDEAYVKGCAATCSASDLDICRDPNYKCDVSCCSSDYCNGAYDPRPPYYPRPTPCTSGHCNDDPYPRPVHCSSGHCNGASGHVFSGLLLIVTASLVYLFGF